MDLLTPEAMRHAVSSNDTNLRPAIRAAFRRSLYILVKCGTCYDQRPNLMSAEIYRYMNFDQMEEYQEMADLVPTSRPSAPRWASQCGSPSSARPKNTTIRPKSTVLLHSCKSTRTSRGLTADWSSPATRRTEPRRS